MIETSPILGFGDITDVLGKADALLDKVADSYDEAETAQVKTHVVPTSDTTVSVLFEDVHILDLEPLFDILGTEEGRAGLLWTVAQQMAQRILDEVLPIPYALA